MIFKKLCRKRYEKEMTIFKPPRDPNKPKRPSTAYFHFMADFRAKMKGSDISHKDVIRYLTSATKSKTLTKGGGIGRGGGVS